MTNAVTALRLRIEELTGLLAEKEAQMARDKIAIASLGKSLNNALASRVQELQRFRSEFFGRLRDVLRGREDVRIVGDRFVFQSEVLFAQGQADIGPDGQTQLAQLAIALQQRQPAGEIVGVGNGVQDQVALPGPLLKTF